jgi:hypothetical protein
MTSFEVDFWVEGGRLEWDAMEVLDFPRNFANSPRIFSIFLEILPIFHEFLTISHEFFESSVNFPATSNVPP